MVGLAAAATSALSGVAGAGGGVVLLLVLTLVVDPAVAIPVHGLVQIMANGTRAVSLGRRVRTDLIGWYVLALVPFAVVGLALADRLPRDPGRLLIGVFALVAVWWPAATSWLGRAGGGRRFMVVGAVAGVLNPTIGAPGPLLAPAFRAATGDHRQFVATFASAQILGHLSKVVGFSVLGVAWVREVGLVAVAVVGVVAGTLVGTRWLLPRLAPEPATRLFRVVVTATAARLVVGALV